MIFLHHGLGSVAQWRDFPPRVSSLTGLPALVYDRRGHGRSSPIERYSPRYVFEEAVELDALLRSEAITNFVLIGHSDGGTIALIHGASPSAIPPAGIISIAAHTFVDPLTRRGIREAADNHAFLRSKLARFHGDKTDTLFWNWAGHWLSPSFDDFDIRDRLPRITCPVLAIQGDQDEFGERRQLSAIAGRVAGPVESAFIPGAGHEPHLQAGPSTLAIVGPWLRRFSPGAPDSGKLDL